MRLVCYRTSILALFPEACTVGCLSILTMQMNARDIRTCAIRLHKSGVLAQAVELLRGHVGYRLNAVLPPLPECKLAVVLEHPLQRRVVLHS